MAEIRTKTDFYRLWMAGALGNRLRVWDSLGAWLQSGYTGPTTLRSAGPIPFCLYDLPIEQVTGAVVGLVDERGVRPVDIRYHESMPLRHLTFQGEVCEVGHELHGYIGRSDRHMRAAMTTGQLRPVVGFAVRDALRRHMDAASFDDVGALLELYPGAAVEFSCYDRDLGIIPGRNTVIWEVRHY